MTPIFEGRVDSSRRVRRGITTELSRTLWTSEQHSVVNVRSELHIDVLLHVKAVLHQHTAIPHTESGPRANLSKLLQVIRGVAEPRLGLVSHEQERRGIARVL